MINSRLLSDGVHAQFSTGGTRACLELEQLCFVRNLNLDRDVLQLKKDLYKLEDLKNEYISMLREGEGILSSTYSNIRHKIQDLSERIQGHNKFRNVGKDFYKFLQIILQYERATIEGVQSSQNSNSQTTISSSNLLQLAQSPKRQHRASNGQETLSRSSLTSLSSTDSITKSPLTRGRRY